MIFVSVFEKSVKPHQQELPLSHTKRSHCQISSGCTQRLFEKCPTESIRIATKRFLYAKYMLLCLRKRPFTFQVFHLKAHAEILLA